MSTCSRAVVRGHAIDRAHESTVARSVPGVCLNRPMSQAERSFLIGSSVFAALVATDVSVIAWLTQNFRTGDAVLVVLAVIAVACITAGIVGVNHAALRRIAQLENL